MTPLHMKGEQILDITGKNAGITIKDISQEGIHLEQNTVDQATGKFNAAGFTTVNVKQKTDGTSSWEQKGIMNTMEGDFVALWGKGTGKQSGPTTATWEGEVHFMTQSPKLAWLNNTKGWVEGSGDQAAGTFQGKIYENK
jgi:hypothetical protein